MVDMSTISNFGKNCERISDTLVDALETIQLNDHDAFLGVADRLDLELTPELEKGVKLLKDRLGVAYAATGDITDEIGELKSQLVTKCLVGDLDQEPTK